jgi:hypothetical protein
VTVTLIAIFKLRLRGFLCTETLSKATSIQNISGFGFLYTIDKIVNTLNKGKDGCSKTPDDMGVDHSKDV